MEKYFKMQEFIIYTHYIAFEWSIIIVERFVSVELNEPVFMDLFIFYGIS